jgi:hypothetical protein
LGLSADCAVAHVPYIERTDHGETRPFVVKDVAQSKAIHAGLESPQDSGCIKLEVTEPVELPPAVIVPACHAYADFLPWYAVIGPGPPPPDEPLPVPPAAWLRQDRRARAAPRRTERRAFSSIKPPRAVSTSKAPSVNPVSR